MFLCHCNHPHKRVRAERKSLAEAAKGRTIAVIDEVTLADTDTDMSSLTHLQEIASVSRSKRTAIEEVCQKPQCGDLMREETSLHSL